MQNCHEIAYFLSIWKRKTMVKKYLAENWKKWAHWKNHWFWLLQIIYPFWSGYQLKDQNFSFNLTPKFPIPHFWFTSNWKEKQAGFKELWMWLSAHSRILSEFLPTFCHFSSKNFEVPSENPILLQNATSHK